MKHWNGHPEEIIRSIVALCLAVKTYLFLFYNSAMAKFTAHFFQQNSPSVSTPASAQSKQKRLLAKADVRSRTLPVLSPWTPLCRRPSQVAKEDPSQRARRAERAFPAPACPSAMGTGSAPVLPQPRRSFRPWAAFRAGLSYSGRNAMHCITLLSHC